MAANLGISGTSKAELVNFLGPERYEDYFGEAEGGDSIVGGASADVDVANSACTLECIVDRLLLQACEAFEQQGHEQEVPNTIVPSSMFAAP